MTGAELIARSFPLQIGTVIPTGQYIQFVVALRMRTAVVFYRYTWGLN